MHFPSLIQLLPLFALSALGAYLPATSRVQGGRLLRRDDPPGLQGGSRISEAQVEGIEGLLNRTAVKSWEIGTHLEALLEFYYPSLSPFSSTSTPWSSPSPSLTSSPDTYPRQIVTTVSSLLSSKSSSSLQIMPDGSAADPASIGFAVALAAALTEDGGTLLSNGSARVSKEEAERAVEEQVEALWNRTPRTGDGAISHRVEDVELWSDFVYMVPPFFAYLGALTSNSTLIQAAFDQSRLYRQYLHDNRTGVWTHIFIPGGGEDEDDGLWATGNGWASSGMLRVLASIMNADNSSIATEFAEQSNDLARWTSEIVEAAWNMPIKDGLLYNYLNQTSSFPDAAGTALLVASTYRLALLTSRFSSALSASNSTPSAHALNAAESSYQVLTSPNHLSPSGVLSPVTNPMSYSNQLRNVKTDGTGSVSPEGEAFVLLMEAARRDHLEAGGQPGVVSNSTSAAVGGKRVGAACAVVVGIAAAMVW